PDLNRRPSGYEPDELPDCSIPRLWGAFYSLLRGCQALSFDLSKVFRFYFLEGKEKGHCMNSGLFLNLVAGAGFEPTTFGL
ncbi:hypothetical protein, partial [Pseudomonas putida]|uniref:hypothetical protein n=1 Tax=Pseudomonas putida TaxID=303 RepID=UPI0019552539